VPLEQPPRWGLLAVRVNQYFSMLFGPVRIPINLYHLPFATGVPISHELLHAMEKYAILAEGNNFTKQIAAGFAAKRAGRDTRDPIIKLEAAMKPRCDGGVDEYGPMKYALRLPMGRGNFINGRRTPM